MKYLTLEAYHAWTGEEELVDDPIYAGLMAYRSRLKELLGILPDHLQELANDNSLDDGLIISVKWDAARETLTLTMRCGNLIVGYFDLILTYRDAVILPEHDRVLATIARRTKWATRFCNDQAYDELDVGDDGLIEHRLLFYPGEWFMIRCRSLEWVKIPQPNRRLPRRRDRYPGGPVVVIG